MLTCSEAPLPSPRARHFERKALTPPSCRPFRGFCQSRRYTMAGRAGPSTGRPLQESVLPVALAVTARLMRPALSPRIDNPRKEPAMNDTDPFFAAYERYREARASLSAGNKKV